MALHTAASKEREGWKSISGRILQLGWPSIAEQILIMLVGIFMTMLIGHISTSAMSAAGMVNSVFFFVQAVFAALSTGSTVLVARLTGEGDHAGVKNAALQSIILVVVSSIVITALCYIFAEPILRLIFGTRNPEAFADGLVLFRILLFSLPMLVINIVVAGVFRGVGNMVLPLVVSAIVNVVYLIFGYTMVNAWHMGIAGAAWAAVIARAIGCALVLIAIYMGKGRVSLSLHDGFKPDLPMIKRIMNIGIPASVEQMVMQGGFLVLNTVVLGFGLLDNAAYQVTMSINSLAFMPAFGLSMASSTLVGHSLGEGSPQKAERYTNYTLLMGAGMLLLMSVVLYFAATPISRLYSNDSAVIDLAARCVKVLALGEPVMALLTILAATLRAAGDIKYIMWTTILGIWLLRIMLSIGVNALLGLGVVGTMWTILVDFVIRTVMYWHRFKRGKWKTIKV